MLKLVQVLKKRVCPYRLQVLQRTLSIILLCLLVLVFKAEAQVVSALDSFATSPATNMTLLNPISKEEGQILVFVSSSMPLVSLRQWFIQAQRLGAVVILRGLVNNSLVTTKAWLTSLMEQLHLEGGVEINPVAFEAFGILQVPAVVVTTEKLQCVSNEHCIAPSFDVVYGNMSLYEALNAIAERGCVGSVLEKQTLAHRKEAP
jgi:conjugal transfer pilus assembly protein TrbC